ncbi:MAG: S41 family peptidase [Candidatus Melainabacteria bacterium]|nr:S41 family peptidase [Candidatus Melainabacteria bacterium]
MKVKMKKLKDIRQIWLIISTVTIASLVSFISLSTYANSLSISPEIVFKTACKALDEKYYFKPTVDFKSFEEKAGERITTLTDAHSYIKKLVKKLGDPYTRFLSKEEFKDELDIMNSKLIGIGVKLDYKKPLILEVLPESPAQKGGLKANDYIIAINNTKTKRLDTNKITNLLRGPKDSKVKIKIKRNHKTSEKTIVREELIFQSITSKILENNIGLIKISSFIPQNTSTSFKEEITKLAHTNGLIIDLRNNSGGLLKNAIEIADMFLSEGKIVTTVQHTGNVNELANSHTLYDGEIVILVNEHTASASEIFASALKENNRAKVIGKRTFGKGLVQEIIRLPDDSAMHITTAAYLTPDGKNIHKVGIVPDSVIKDPKAQLDIAKKHLQLIANHKNKEQKLPLVSLSH